MPSVNIYTSKERIKSIENILPELRDFTAQQLSCRDRRLASNEISLRVLTPDTSLQIADTELEIKAYHYPERVKRQDEICLAIKDYMQRTAPGAGSVYVWLQLSELGHSAKE
ncbi:MAG: hypothetical protein Q8N63_02910 [Nanoarchaeota archaeon]|nr:hypothetical protein [Nanoarchaeota archaeon]